MGLWYVAVWQQSSERAFPGLMDYTVLLDWTQARTQHGSKPRHRLVIRVAWANYGRNNQLISVYKLPRFGFMFTRGATCGRRLVGACWWQRVVGVMLGLSHMVRSRGQLMFNHIPECNSVWSRLKSVLKKLKHPHGPRGFFSFLHPIWD